MKEEYHHFEFIFYHPLPWSINFRAFFILMNTYNKYMRRVIRLAKKGSGWVNPNPMVGALLVKADRIIGE